MSNLVTPFWGRQHNTAQTLHEHKGYDDFLQWPMILNTMFAKNPKWTEVELKYLYELLDFKSRWSKAIVESEVGNPLSNSNLIHLVFHLAMLEKVSGVFIHDLDTVFEAGGGYGCMCKAVHSLGFDGNYTIYDLPKFVKIQEWYLKHFDLSQRFLSSKDQPKLKTVEANGKSLFISTWALSEMPLNLRLEILDQTKNFDYFLLAYQHEIEGVDNIKFFNDLQKERNDLNWVGWEIEYIPKNYYLIGYTKNEQNLEHKT